MKESPTKDRLWFNNGTIQVSRKEKPEGNEWMLGMLPKKKKPPKEKVYKNMSGCANCKCSKTGIFLGRIHKSDPRWESGEICGVNKKLVGLEGTSPSFSD